MARATINAQPLVPDTIARFRGLARDGRHTDAIEAGHQALVKPAVSVAQWPSSVAVILLASMYSRGG
jgi:hypothetical protein